MEVIKTYKILNILGLHARPAAKIVSLAEQYRSKIFFEREGKIVNGRSLLSLLTLACPFGSHLTIRAEGSDAEDAIRALGSLILNKFGED